jgi:hypothetical protein
VSRYRIICWALISGIVLIFLSILFYVAIPVVYKWMAGLGLVISSISFLLVLFGNYPTQVKRNWILIVIASVVIQWFSEPVFIQFSYRLYIAQNEEVLSAINQLFIPKTTGAQWKPGLRIWKGNDVSVEDSIKLSGLFVGTRIVSIRKEQHKIIYNIANWKWNTFSMSYLTKKIEETNRSQIVDNWYMNQNR